jgi:hypothetical protein
VARLAALNGRAGEAATSVPLPLLCGRALRYADAHREHGLSVRGADARRSQVAGGIAAASFTALEAQQTEPRRIATAPAFNARQLTAHPAQNWITNRGNVFKVRDVASYVLEVLAK